MNLTDHPKPEEVLTNADGSQYIPIGIVEQLLDEYCLTSWDTQNFKIYFNPEYDIISASIELALRYDNHQFRILTGGVTFKAADYAPNEDFAGIAISECIKNAAKKLGNRFGRSLNGRLEKKPITVKESVKLKPDQKIRMEYIKAIERNDISKADQLERIYEFQIGE